MAALAARGLVRPVVDADDRGRVGVPLLACPGPRRGLRAAAAQGAGAQARGRRRLARDGRPASARRVRRDRRPPLRDGARPRPRHRRRGAGRVTGRADDRRSQRVPASGRSASTSRPPSATSPAPWSSPERTTSERLRILPGWAETLLLRNRYREAAAAYEEAIAGLSASGDIRAAALAMCWLADVLPTLGEPVLRPDAGGRRPPGGRRSLGRAGRGARPLRPRAS